MVYHVTNLNDAGPGSFREAVSQDNRIVVFDVGGYAAPATTNRTVNAAIKVNGENWKSCDDVTKTIAALTGPPDNVVETLDAIRARQKGETPEAATVEAVTLTVGRAVEFLLAYIKNDAKAATELEAATLFAGCVELGNAWGDSGVSEDLMNKWNSNIDNGIAPEMNVETAPNTLETPAEPQASEDKELVEQS